jgi:1-acyl-sn-glycerol-3-phosphate acyltransferase
VGYVARLAGTMFVRRHWRLALVQRDALAARLRAGESLILFGEGTSTDGLDVKPFKTSLLSVAEPWVLDRPIAIQPVTIVHLRLADGTPIGAANNELYAWWGRASLAPHFWRMAKLPGVEIEVHFGPPVLSWSVTSRKILGPQLRDEVRRTLHARRGSRPTPQDEPASPSLAGDPVPQGH